MRFHTFSEAVGHVRTPLDAFGCDGMRSDASGSFRNVVHFFLIFERFQCINFQAIVCKNRTTTYIGNNCRAVTDVLEIESVATPVFWLLNVFTVFSILHRCTVASLNC